MKGCVHLPNDGYENKIFKNSNCQRLACLNVYVSTFNHNTTVIVDVQWYVTKGYLQFVCDIHIRTDHTFVTSLVCTSSCEYIAHIHEIT